MNSDDLSEHFNKKWIQCFKASKFSNEPNEAESQVSINYAGNFCIIKNNQYKNKRTTNTIDKSFELKTITLPFANQAFNFNKIRQCQILFAIDFDQHTPYLCSMNQSSHHFVIINSCPILQSHALFIPFMKKNHPQIMTSQLLNLSLEMSLMFPKMKFGFNSQGAASSVNHFHLQVLNLERILPKNRFSFQDINGNLLTGAEDIQITHFCLHQAHYLKFFSSKCLLAKKQQVKIVTMRVIDYLLKQNIPHNLVITDVNSIYIIVRGYANQQCKYGWLEYSGVFIAKSAEQFEMDALAIENSFKKIQYVPSGQITHLLTMLENVL